MHLCVGSYRPSVKVNIYNLYYNGVLINRLKVSFFSIFRMPVEGDEEKDSVSIPHL